MIAPYHQPEFDALLRSILDTPDDDLPRLIAADWCDEHGYAAEAECLRTTKPKRLPVDEWTVRACEQLPLLLQRNRFVQDVCPGVVPFGTGRVERSEGNDHMFLWLAENPKDRLSPKQFLWVWKLVLKYRGHLQPDLVARADELLTTEQMRRT